MVKSMGMSMIEKYMKEALIEAETAGKQGEIPVGAVIVKDGEIIGRGHNSTEGDGDPTAHAEINAIRMAGKRLRETLGWRRLTGCDMYVTMEPCSMCAGALVWARIDNLYVGVMDPKAGGCGSVLNIIQEEKLNHHINLYEIEQGPIKCECGKIVQDFFRELRLQQKIKKSEETNR